jgi:hypothetical protein
MTYEATVQFKFDATFTPTYGSGFGSTVVDDFIPEEHYLITAPAADLNSTQYGYGSSIYSLWCYVIGLQ